MPIPRPLQSLFERQSEEVRAERELQESTMEQLATLLTSDGMSPFREWLKRAIRQARPVPGETAMVNYAIGFSNGLEHVLDQLDVWEKEIKDAREREH